ncbi:hypothetical protein FKR81_34350 [Lentzea tibetensis]|uniref:Uncharacterized protein n=1 Tax=Lentzea tibetensis TaxID=2591470 RepID=A0A563EJ82_9PSEU|nr:hypothetical protein [Lentzea tibetensis]TWP46888.1 hypothetical protein FKR81_34350 [Lentzea tibetensis]
MPVDLDGWRADPSRWTEVACDEVVGADGRQEVLAHRAAQWSVGESIVEATELPSRYGQADDVWLLREAQCANGDTLVGIDAAALCPVGVPETIAFVEAGAHPDRDALLDHLVSHREEVA